MISAVNRRLRLSGSEQLAIDNRQSIKFSTDSIMKKIKYISLYFLPIAYCLLSIETNAQDSSVVFKPRVAIFAPLYLDSAFDATNNYRYGAIFPKFINPGLEFYEGAQLALDSLNKEGKPIEVFVFDTHSSQKTLTQQLQQAEKDSVQLIIAYSETVKELQHFASSSQMMKIPFVNVNLPNDGGVYSNPYFVILNSTLRTHIEGIYRYIQKYYSLDNIIVFRKKGQMEDLIKNYFDEAGKTTASVPLKIKYVELSDSFSAKQLQPELDSNTHTLCIAGSLDENFGKRLTLQLASISQQYPVSLIGMPTFDNMDREFSRPEYKGIEIIYSTPFYNARTDKVSVSITEYFSSKMYARPSDMVMRGYETTWRFSKLLLKYKQELSSNITHKEFNVFREFDIQPVLNKQTNTLDYFENKKLYFIKWQDGVVKVVN